MSCWACFDNVFEIFRFHFFIVKRLFKEIDWADRLAALFEMHEEHEMPVHDQKIKSLLLYYNF